jgi:hypothetical protein
MSRIVAKIQTFCALKYVIIVAKIPPVTLPAKSKTLSIRNKKGTNKSLLKRVLSASHFFEDSIKTKMDGNSPNVITNVKKTETEGIHSFL